MSVGADAYMPLVHSAMADLERGNVEQVAPLLVRDGLRSQEDVDAHLSVLASKRLQVMLPPLVSAWGQPAAVHHENALERCHGEGAQLEREPRWSIGSNVLG